MSNELQIVKDQKIFMVAANQTISNNNPNQRELYETLITEEFNEFKSAIDENEPLPHQVKEAIDMIVVILGWLISAGTDVDEAWNLVWGNNMMKVANKMAKKREDGKVMKSEESIALKAQMMEDLKKTVKL